MRYLDEEGPSTPGLSSILNLNVKMISSDTSSDELGAKKNQKKITRNTDKIDTQNTLR